VGRLKKIAYPTKEGNTIYVHKRIIDLLKRKCAIISQQIQYNKIVFEYKDKKYGTHGVMELYDVGPDVPKKL
jgi:hypothetical protein